MAMSKAQARIEIGLLNAEAAGVNRIDIFTDFINKDLPSEIITRMDDLWRQTKVIAGEIIHVGKIIIMKIWEFVKANPNMAIGMAVGVAVGSLIKLIPFIGSLLAPLTMAIGAVLGGVAGHRLDKIEKGQRVSDGVIGVTEDLITMTKEFFKLFAEIFDALKEYFA